VLDQVVCFGGLAFLAPVAPGFIRQEFAACFEVCGIGCALRHYRTFPTLLIAFMFCSPIAIRQVGIIIEPVPPRGLSNRKREPNVVIAMFVCHML